MSVISMHRRHILVGLSLLASGLFGSAEAQTTPQTAPTKEPMLIYDDVLSPGWSNWSWAKTALSVDIKTDVKPISVEGDPYSALFLHHAPFSTEGYSYLTFFVNGGEVGGQPIAVKAIINDKPVDPGYPIRLNAKTWNKVSVPLAEIGAANQTISGFWLQAMTGSAYPTYYVTLIQLE
jgi:hypothetical protein